MLQIPTPRLGPKENTPDQATRNRPPDGDEAHDPKPRQPESHLNIPMPDQSMGVYGPDIHGLTAIWAPGHQPRLELGPTLITLELHPIVTQSSQLPYSPGTSLLDRPYMQALPQRLDIPAGYTIF